MCTGNTVSSSDVVTRKGRNVMRAGHGKTAFLFFKSPEEKEIQYGQGSASI